MKLTSTPQGSEKVWRLRENLHHETARQFTVHKWWHTPLRSAVYACVGMLFSAMTVSMIATFPWDDSTVEQKHGMLFIMLPMAFLSHDLLAMLFFVLAVRTWADPHTLIFDGEGDLILRSVVRDQRIAIEDIRTIALEQQKNGEPSIRTKFSVGQMKLPHFAEREEFLKALNTAHPAIVVVTV
ncbi:MAG: hypothetical protein ABL936_07320 [Aestuariivirga sp.]